MRELAVDTKSVSASERICCFSQNPRCCEAHSGGGHGGRALNNITGVPFKFNRLDFVHACTALDPLVETKTTPYQYLIV